MGLFRCLEVFTESLFLRTQKIMNSYFESLSNKVTPNEFNLVGSVLGRFLTVTILGQRPQTSEKILKGDLLYSKQAINPDDKTPFKGYQTVPGTETFNR